MFDLQQANELCRVLGEPTRVRILLVLAQHPLSVAELTQVTGLAQSRVSTHLSRLREVGLVESHRNGSTSYYRTMEKGLAQNVGAVWTALREHLSDPLLEGDRERATNIVSARQSEDSWSASVAGRMERHYSPGRTWEASARAFLGFANLGDVLDIGSGDGAISELLVERAHSVTCLDINKKVIAAASRRLSRRKNVTFIEGDMHKLPLSNCDFDHVLLMNALTYAENAAMVFREVSRVLKPGGTLIGVTLDKHDHAAVVQQYNHLQLGFQVGDLVQWIKEAQLDVIKCEVTHTEKRAPHFSVITFFAKRSSEPLDNVKL